MNKKIKIKRIALSTWLGISLPVLKMTYFIAAWTKNHILHQIISIIHILAPQLNFLLYGMSLGFWVGVHMLA